LSEEFTVTVTGMDAVIQRLNSLASAAERIAGARAVVGTNVNYARFIEEGSELRHGVMVTRRAGPAHMLSGALETEGPAIEAALESAVKDVLGGGGADSLVQALNRAGLQVQATAQRNTPVKTGNLRRSLHTELQA
jgi:hypothetical protein